ncbi:vacuolar fusion protein CCZ1 homolog [Argiope bruennichi]|uniref:Vacuolar fusion protein CCZ1 like protein n=1 Tax=Argiope bruennichi TaxID=94029 RepID=A0A8T0EKG0_ARGBR|nr:vacuolar fusion protein CCZ1 homolog [Argiope bruennichi]KAF8774440.1 Vacuolar fusion protein CCZ1 like protein [Argiope bruennichi]
MSSKSSISLGSFFVFNSSYCRHENDEKNKILYYYPAEVDLNSKVRSVGLCEAVIKFTSTFGTSPCEALHTQKTKQVFLEPEPGFWMVMTLNVPCQQKSRDGQVYMEYFTDEIQDHVYQSLLLKSYRMFTLMHGTFSSIVGEEKENVIALRKKLNEFYENYLMNLKSSDADLLDIFQGIHFLPLERYSFLKILCFINQVEEKFRCVKYSVFLYNDQLVWSGLEPEDTQILYQHLSLELIPSFIDSEVKGGVFSPSRTSPFGSGSHFGRFMTGPKSVEDLSGLQNIPKIFLSNGKICCYLITYRALNATVCLLVEDTFELKIELFKSLDAELGNQLSNLASEVGEQYSKTISILNAEQQSKFMYMYFNHMNLAEKTTMHADMKSTGHALIPSDIMKLFGDFYTDLSKMKDFGEIIGKTLSDCWVVGKLSDERELYVILQQKNANIVDVNDELKKLSASYFQSIFIMD